MLYLAPSPLRRHRATPCHWSESGYQVWRSLVWSETLCTCMLCLTTAHTYHWRIGAICISLRIMGSINLPRLLSLSRHFFVTRYFWPTIFLQKWTENLLCDHYRTLVCTSAATFPVVHAIYNIHTWSKNFLSPSLLRSSACWNSITLQQLVRWLAGTPHQNRFK